MDEFYTNREWHIKQKFNPGRVLDRKLTNVTVSTTFRKFRPEIIAKLIPRGVERRMNHEFWMTTQDVSTNKRNR